MIVKQNQDRVLYLDILRIITIFAVIILHVSGARWYAAFGTSEWYVLNTFLTLVRWSVPVFFMLSGAIILDPEYKLTFKKLYTKSIPRLVCALLFWSIAYRTLSPITANLLNLKVITSNDWERIYTEIFLGTPWHHLWFMYVIIGMYILAPLIRVFTANAEKKHYYYFFILYLIFGSIIPKINAAYTVHLSFGIDELYSYSGYFIAGYFFAKYNLAKREKNILFIIGVLTAIWTVASSTLWAINKGYPGAHYLEYMAPQTMILACFIFVLIKNTVNNNAKILTLKNNKYVTLLASCSFGIYLVHDFFNILLNLLHISTNSIPPILSIPLLSIFVYTASLGIILIIRKIPVLNKWII